MAHTRLRPRRKQRFAITVADGNTCQISDLLVDQSNFAVAFWSRLIHSRISLLIIFAGAFYH
jgi:hypothetical protein